MAGAMAWTVPIPTHGKEKGLDVVVVVVDTGGGGGGVIICPQCGAKNGQRTAEPVKCTRCWYRFDREGVNGKRVGGTDAGDVGVGAAGELDRRGLDGLAVSFLREAKEPAVGLCAVPAVRGELVGRNGPGKKPAREAVERGSDIEVAACRDIDLCGFRAYNDTDGEWYLCGMEKHGPKVKHGKWVKE